MKSKDIIPREIQLELMKNAEKRHQEYINRMKTNEQIKEILARKPNEEK